MFKIASKLEEGDLIDLAPVVREFFDYTEEELDHDLSAFELALVEDVEQGDGFVVIYTDQHNISVPPTFKFSVGQEFELDESLELEEDFA